MDMNSKLELDTIKCISIPRWSLYFVEFLITFNGEFIPAYS